MRSRRLVARVRALLYTTPEPPGADAPLLVVHDGPEYAQYSGTHALPRRDELGGAHPAAAGRADPAGRPERDLLRVGAVRAALARELLPELTRRVPHGRCIGMGASLGALAMLHAHVRHPQVVRRSLPPVGQLLPAALRPARVVVSPLPPHHALRRRRPSWRNAGPADPGGAHRGHRRGEPPEQSTRSRDSLGAHGYGAWLAEIRDAHNWTCWRDGFDPNLPALIEAST